MHQGFTSQKRLSTGWIHWPLLLLLLLAAGTPATADSFQLAARLEGWDCPWPNTGAMAAEGLDLYVGGGSGCKGLAWFRRDPASGRLDLEQVWGARELNDERLHSLALSHDGRHLFASVGEEIWTFARAPDGGLEKVSTWVCPFFCQAEAVAVAPDDLEVWMFLHSEIFIFSRAANGFLTLKQGVDVHLSTTQSGAFTFLAADRAVVGSRVLIRQNGTWIDQQALGVDVYPRELATDASGRYLYSLDSFSFSVTNLVTYDFASGNPVEVARLRLSESYPETYFSRIARHPLTGDLYLTSTESSLYQPNFAAVRRYSSADGGKRFTMAEELTENVGSSPGELLVASPDGRHLYTSFEAEPVALLTLDPAGGLAYVEDGVDVDAGLREVSRMVPAANGDVYLPVPGAILLARWSGGRLAIVDRFDFPEWNMAYATQLDLAITPGGTLAVVIAQNDWAATVRVALAERDPGTGELRLRPETTVYLNAYDLPRLIISPDGRYVYVYSEYNTPTSFFYLRRDVLKLVDGGALYSAGKVVFSPDGAEAFLGGRFFKRDVVSGLMTQAPNPWPGFIKGTPTYSRDGKLLVMRENFPDPAPQYRYRVLERNGPAWNELYQGAFSDERNYYDLLADPAGRHFHFATKERDIDGQLAVERWEWRSGGESPIGLAERLADRPPAYGQNRGQELALSREGHVLYLANPDRSTFEVWRLKCEPGNEFAACLGAGRFRVEADWRDAYGVPHPAVPAPVGSDDSRLFTFFAPDNWEVLTKVLDGCAINQRFWVFSAATTDVGHDLRVIDTWSGREAKYSNPAGTPAAAITDAGALDVCGVPSPGWTPVVDNLPPVTPAGPLLLVQNGRFEVSATWTTGAGQQGTAQALSARTAAAGLFYFFSQDNWEVQAKVLDGCAINGKYWFYAAATTDVGYTLKVRDLATNREKLYENPVGRAAPAITDSSAFPCQ